MTTLPNKVLQLADPACHGPGFDRDRVYFSQVGSCFTGKPGPRQSGPQLKTTLDSPTDAMQIREATPDDRGVIIALDNVAGLEPGRIKFIDRVLQSAACLVAERDRRVIAYAALEYTFFDNGFVSIVYVAQPERRRGIGRALMNALASRCETRKLFTSTNESNQPMLQLLNVLGYVPSGVIHNLDPGDPELVFFLDLGRRAV